MKSIINGISISAITTAIPKDKISIADYASNIVDGKTEPNA